MSRSVTLKQIIAFRLDGHNLSARLPAGAILQAAGACGIQNTPPGSAVLSLHARVAGLSSADVDQALEVDKTLLQTWSLRASPHLFPIRDAHVFTRGLLPPDEDSTRFFILGIKQALTVMEMSAAEVVERVGAAMRGALDGCMIVSKKQLDVQIAQRVEPGLTPQQLAAWRSPSLYGPDQQLGEALVSFALRPLSLQGAICFGPRRGNEASFARVDQWLGTALPQIGADEARAELVRRYLRCYGPSTPGHLAEWAGIAPAQAHAAWALVEHELVQVGWEGSQGWLLAADLARLISPPKSRGVRLLPPHDPYLQLRDRSTLVPDRERQRDVWQTVGSPGVVLIHGQWAAIWRAQKKGKRLLLSIKGLPELSHAARVQLHAEASALASFKGCTSFTIQSL